ncbi:MAG: BamA/TamA family outer membrane protein [Paludibacteraceae bacterium]|nr:BamA/TamA family outer membrane protein [Paludibacteraceae bacterium]
MKRKIVLLFACLSVAVLSAQEDMHDLAPLADDTLVSTVSKKELLAVDSTVTEKKGLFGHKNKKDIIKKGFSFGPLPVVAFDQDRGLQYGALLNIYDFGDGSTYPQPRQQWYLEASAYTKGGQKYIVTYDTRHLIPHVRMSLAGNVMIEKALDFYGFNGYQSFYDFDNVTALKDAQKAGDVYSSTNLPNPEYMTAFYRVDRLVPTFKADFSGNIWDHKLLWEAGYHFSWFRMRSIDQDRVNKGKDSVYMFSGETLYDKYKAWGVIPADEADGGFSSALRLGLVYDTRDYEAAPNRGIWADVHAMIAPKFLGTTHPYYRYSATFRQYVPIVKDQLTFAYRVVYQGTMGKSAPYYVLPYITNMGLNFDREAFGGYRSTRGLLFCRLQGLDLVSWNSEFRWKFVKFPLLNQNVALGLSAFFDGGMVTRPYDMSYNPAPGTDTPALRAAYDAYMAKGTKEMPHMAAGGGFRVIINHNFIVAVEYGMPFNHQDGGGSLYINTGYLF